MCVRIQLVVMKVIHGGELYTARKAKAGKKNSHEAMCRNSTVNWKKYNTMKNRTKKGLSKAMRHPQEKKPYELADVECFN